MRRPTRPARGGRFRSRAPFAVASAALAVGCLASPAAAAPAPTTPPSAPVVTPSTTGTVPPGTPMTMTIARGSAADAVYGYAWTWQPSSNAPVYSTLPSCGSDDATGGIHFVCGSTAALRVSPETPPFDGFTVWAFDAAGNRSAATTVPVSTVAAGASAYPVTHQWTTDSFGMPVTPASCGVGAWTVTCVPDTAGVDATHPNGAHPLLLPPGVTWDGSGSGQVAGVLNFGPANALPAGTLAPVADTRASFTVGGWLTPTAAPAGKPETAIAQEGTGRAGFELGLTADGRWQFRVHSASGTAAAAVASGTASTGSAVYVAGVWDAVNKEVRLYVNGGQPAVTGFAPRGAPSANGGVTVGARLGATGVTERWTGQVGNPVVAQAPLTSTDIAALRDEGFFPGSDLG